MSLSCQGEELKKEVEEKTELLTEAARAIESLQAKQAARLASLTQQLDRERADRHQAEQQLRLAPEAGTTPVSRIGGSNGQCPFGDKI